MASVLPKSITLLDFDMTRQWQQVPLKTPRPSSHFAVRRRTLYKAAALLYAAIKFLNLDGKKCSNVR